MSLEYKLPPASTLKVAPLIKEAPGESKKHTAEDTSSGVPKRLAGISERASLNTSTL